MKIPKIFEEARVGALNGTAIRARFDAIRKMMLLFVPGRLHEPLSDALPGEEYAGTLKDEGARSLFRFAAYLEQIEGPPAARAENRQSIRLVMPLLWLRISAELGEKACDARIIGVRKGWKIVCAAHTRIPESEYDEVWTSYASDQDLEDLRKMRGEK